MRIRQVSPLLIQSLILTRIQRQKGTEDIYIEFEGEQGHGHHRNHHYHRRYGHFI